jgi:biopolymer transport protein TolR
VYLENRLLLVDEVETKLGTIVKYRKDKDVLLRADRDIPYGTVVKVIAGIKRAGVEKLGMVTEPVERIE